MGDLHGVDLIILQAMAHLHSAIAVSVTQGEVSVGEVLEVAAVAVESPVEAGFLVVDILPVVPGEEINQPVKLNNEKNRSLPPRRDRCA